MWDQRQVTQAFLVEGRNRVRIYEPRDRPPAAFEPVPPTLDEAYMVLIQQGTLPQRAAA